MRLNPEGNSVELFLERFNARKEHGLVTEEEALEIIEDMFGPNVLEDKNANA